MAFNTGARYEGMWTNGRMHGKGLYIWADGRRYEGEWVRGERHGHGISTMANGEKHDGAYIHNMMNGAGWWRFTSGKVRPGEWRDDKLLSTLMSTLEEQNREIAGDDDGEEVEELERYVEHGGGNGEAAERGGGAFALEAPHERGIHGAQDGVQEQRRDRGRRQRPDARVQALLLVRAALLGFRNRRGGRRRFAIVRG